LDHNHLNAFLGGGRSYTLTTAMRALHFFLSLWNRLSSPMRAQDKRSSEFTLFY
jgi:hypothetical protein